MNSHTTLHLLNLDTVGGVEELFIHFLEASSVYPCTHRVLITGKKPHPFFQERLARYASSQDLEKYLMGMKIPRFLRNARRKQVIRQRKPDCILLWNRLEPLHSLNAPTIYYEHGASWIEPHNSDSASFLKGMNKILANSHAAKRLLELKWGIQDPITVIQNPLKPLTAAPTHKKAPDITLRPLQLGYIGRLIPLKGVALLLHAVKELNSRKIPVVLSIAGDGTERERLQEEAKKLQINSRVHFLGCIQDVERFYREIDLLLVPSIREPLGLVAQEAALLACPVIACRVDGLPEVVIDGETGLCLTPSLDVKQYAEFGGSGEKLPDMVYDPASDELIPPRLLDPKVIADSIEKLVCTPTMYEAFSQEGLEFAKRRPTIKEYTKSLCEAIMEY